MVRVSEPLASWRRHSGSITLQAGVEHGRELLRLVDVGARVLGLSPDQTAIRAEALRNACIQAAFHGDTDDLSKDDALATIDLTRPATSAFTGGIERDEMPDERVDQVAELWRELAQLTRRLAEVRTYGLGLESSAPAAGQDWDPEGPQGGAPATDRLGLLDGEGEANPTAWDGDAVPLELIEAAVECEADIDPATSRYLVLDRHAQKIPEEEFYELNWMGHRATTDQLSDAVADRRRKLEAAGVQPGTADL